MHKEFAVHMLNEEGKKKATEIAAGFSELLTKLEALVPAGRELALVRTKLEEACFFAKKGMAQQNCETSQAAPPAASPEEQPAKERSYPTHVGGRYA